jgi:hypothetical protein
MQKYEAKLSKELSTCRNADEIGATPASQERDLPPRRAKLSANDRRLNSEQPVQRSARFTRIL